MSQRGGDAVDDFHPGRSPRAIKAERDVAQGRSSQARPTWPEWASIQPARLRRAAWTTASRLARSSAPSRRGPRPAPGGACGRRRASPVALPRTRLPTSRCDTTRRSRSSRWEPCASGSPRTRSVQLWELGREPFAEPGERNVDRAAGTRRVLHSPQLGRRQRRPASARAGRRDAGLGVPGQPVAGLRGRRSCPSARCRRAGAASAKSR